MKKKIFCDIDGTLAKRMHKISRKNVIAIAKYVRTGGDFILCTGRSSVSAYKFQEQISNATQKEPNYVICSNGGYIIDNISKSIITYNIINSISWQIYNECIKHKVWCLFYTKESNDRGGVFASKVWFRWILKMSKAIQCFKIYQNTNLKAFKIIVVSVSTRKIKTFINILEKKFKDKVSFVNTNKRLIEINAITTSKSSAIEYILKKNNESKKDVAAIGDSPNDIPMFKKVSLPISVRTKNKEVIQASKYHIPKFKNAISVAINKYII